MVLCIDRRVVLPEGAHDVVVNAPFEMDSSGMGTWFGLLDVQVSPNNRSPRPRKRRLEAVKG